jgi:pimeloyl-ACP methyl ester carboxylesterase
MKTLEASTLLALTLSLATPGCFSDAPEGLAPADDAQTTVKFDFLHKPLPEIPLPNDVATRYDPNSATLRRINASMLAPTSLERRTRTLLDGLDGWGLFQPVTVPFTGPLDLQSILDAHRDADYDFSDDVIYLIDITRDSPDFGKPVALDLGNGNYPAGTEGREDFWPNDPRAGTMSITFEEFDEDENGNGELDPGEDTDSDGVLDRPNYLPGKKPAWDDLAAREDALMSFYERETNTLIAVPVVPLRERTTYAVVVTKRLLDADGAPVGSPFPFINHASQTEALSVLPEVLPAGLSLGDVAFAFSYTTQTTSSEWQAVRDGLYGHGVQKHLASEFPAEITSLELAKDAARFPKSKRLSTLFAEEFDIPFRLLNTAIGGIDPSSEAMTRLMDGYQYIDYLVMGSFDAPQLFDREDADGKPLPMDAQSWPTDLDRVPAKARAEKVYFTLVTPRKEISARKDGKPAPVVILGHGHGGNRFTALNFGPYFARHGIAVLAIDNPGHGISIAPEDKEQAKTILGGFGIGPFIDSVFKDRALDLNFDGLTDSGGDFWTFYLFHTRDNVRQSALDYMQLIRILRGFDGKHRWNIDVDGDGENDLAGDFDGDGEVDVGGSGAITMTGGSLGGIMAMLMGGLEPELDAIGSIIGGGSLGTMSRRSTNGAVRRAIVLRAFGPLFLATPTEDGKTRVETLVPDLDGSPATRTLATVAKIPPGATMVVENLANGELGCGLLSPDALGRAPVAADLGDPLRIRFYAGDIVRGKDCVLATGARVIAEVATFGEDTVFQDQAYSAGDPLVALAEGMGLQRSSPDFRRFAGLGPLVMDRADPAVYARHLLNEPLIYPGTGQKTGAHALVTTAIGDLNVPVDSGMTFARAAGILDYLHPNPAFGVPDNQVLIDHHVPEGIDELKRYTDPDGVGVLLDPNDFSGDSDLWAGRVPRLDPPLRSGFDTKDALGGRSAAIFAYGSPQGMHGFDPPGEMIDAAREQCETACTTGDCDCNTLEIFDVGSFHFNLIAEYLLSGGKTLNPDLCHSRNDCPAIAAPPARRTGL